MANSISNSVLRSRVKAQNVTANLTIPNYSSVEEFNVGTDGLVITLPQITADNLGETFLFRNVGSAGNNILSIAPNATDAFVGAIPNITGSTASVNRASGVVNKKWINTKATSQNGDFVKVTAVSLTKWYITGGQGVWASEA
jgi:hypothetical protein